MDTYIIRIRRREEGDPGTVAGTVEKRGIPERKAFVNLDQLWDILNPKKKKLAKPKRKMKVLDRTRAHERIHSQ